MKRVITYLMIALLMSTIGGCKNSSPSQNKKVKIRWFIGLGVGTDDGTLEAQQKVVEAFNRRHSHIELVMEIIDNSEAYDTLATQMSAGNAPDIVGPVGIRGRDSFKGAWLDLEPLVKKHQFDLSNYDPEMVNFYKVEGEGLIGLPFAVYPSFLFINKDLFDDAGLAYPPQKFNAPYIDKQGNEKEWNIQTLLDISRQLTLDSNGNNPLSPEFDAQEIIQFGFGVQFGDIRGNATLFGPASLVDRNGQASIPEHWKKAWHWVYAAKWKHHFYPFGSYLNADFLGNGNWFQTGNIAMVQCHLWYAGFAKIQDLNWDLSVIPSYNGQYTAKLHADTFEIMKSCTHPDEAFEVMRFLIKSNELLNVYGGMPADKRLQDQFFEKFSREKFPGHTICWQIAADSIKYADRPSHEAWMPNFQEAQDACDDFFTLLDQDSSMKLDEEITTLEEKLQAIFKLHQSR